MENQQKYIFHSTRKIHGTVEIIASSRREAEGKAYEAVEDENVISYEENGEDIDLTLLEITEIDPEEYDESDEF